MIKILKEAIISSSTMEVKWLIIIVKGEMKRKEIQAALGLKNDDHFRLAYLTPALADGIIEMTQPDSPKSPTQRYRLTTKGRMLKEM